MSYVTRIEVRPKASFSSRISLPTWLSEMGSRPAKGSSYIAQVGIGGDRARERHAPRHAAGKIARAHVLRAAQADRVQLHEHQAARDVVGQREVLGDRKRDVVVHREVAEEARGLEHHPHLQAQPVELARSRARGRSCPPTVTRPREGLSCPPISLSSVDLPEPLPPRIATTLPRGMASDSPRKISRSPYENASPSISTWFSAMRLLYRRAASVCRADSRGRARRLRRRRVPCRRSPCAAQQLREPRLPGMARRRQLARAQVLPPGTLERRAGRGGACLRARARGARNPRRRARFHGHPRRLPVRRVPAPRGASAEPGRPGRARAHRALHRPHPRRRRRSPLPIPRSSHGAHIWRGAALFPAVGQFRAARSRRSLESGDRSSAQRAFTTVMPGRGK